MTLTAGTDVEIVFLKITGKGINYKGKSPPPHLEELVQNPSLGHGAGGGSATVCPALPYSVP